MHERSWVRARSLAGTIALVVATSFATRVNDLAAGPATKTAESTRIVELLKENQSLISRVTRLEDDLSRLAVGMTQMPSRVQAPFEVIDAAGNSLFIVTGDHGSGLGKNSRVRIGRASGDNFLLTIRNATGAAVASMGQTKTGAGGVSLTDPNAQVFRTEILGDLGLVLSDPQGKEIANLGFTSGNSGQSRLQVNGELRTVDAAGKPIFVASDAPLAQTPAARVQVGRADGGAYGIAVRSRINVSAVVLTELSNGAGLVQLGDEIGRPRTALIGDEGLILRNNGWKEVANLGFDPAHKQAGWLRVMSVDAAKPIFTVTDAAEGQTTVGRIHVGRGGESNYGMWVRGGDGKIAAAMGEAKTGGGVVSVRDPAGRPRADLFGQGGVAVYNTSGKEVVTLNLKGDNTESGLLQLRGIFQLFDAAGQTMVEAGTSPNGVGVVRVGPGAKCVPQGDLRVPDCIMGRGHP